MNETLARFQVAVHVRIRPCRADDLPALEWFGMFAAHRPLIRKVFEQQQRGEALMLVAEVNGHASGQAWLDFVSARREGAAELWAVRLLPCLQGRGIGTRLVAVAERAAMRYGFQSVTLGVEQDNPAARRFYERLGYEITGHAAITHRGGVPEVSRQWLLRKRLAAVVSAGGDAQ